jgi:PhnB protein
MTTAREGVHTLIPYLICKDAARAIEFYTRALGAVEIERIDEGDKIGFAALLIGDSRLLLSDDFPDYAVYDPAHYGGSPVAINIYVASDVEVEAWVERAVAAGMTIVRPLSDASNMIRNAVLQCPYGHRWFFTRRRWT